MINPIQQPPVRGMTEAEANRMALRFAVVAVVLVVVGVLLLVVA